MLFRIKFDRNSLSEKKRCHCDWGSLFNCTELTELDDEEGKGGVGSCDGWRFLFFDFESRRLILEVLDGRQSNFRALTVDGHKEIYFYEP